MLQAAEAIIPSDYAPWLWLCSFLLLLRVLGQLAVVLARRSAERGGGLHAPRWLPPMDQWQSGLLPYPVLLLGQVLVLSVMFWICADFSRGQGLFVQPYPGRGQYVAWFSYIYFGGMVLRYVIWMWRRPDQRWFGGTIPIIFHCVVAAFLFAFGAYHVRLAG